MTSAPPDRKEQVTATTINNKPPLPIYPDYCHHLSPTIGKWVPLSAKDVRCLKDVGMFCEQRILHHHLNHPIKWVKITGVVVAIEDFMAKRVWTIDDGSGATVECTGVGAPPVPVESLGERGQKRHLVELAAIADPKPMKVEEKREKKKEEEGPSVQNPVVPWKEVELGTVIKVKGRINAWWDSLQVEAVKVEVLRGLDREVKAWDEVREFRESTLGRPWVVSREEEERCKRRAEKELRRKGRRAKDGKGMGEVKKEKYGKGGEKEREGKRKDLERVKSLDGGGKRRRELDVEKKKISYPSMAVRKAAAGKYDALGI